MPASVFRVAKALSLGGRSSGSKNDIERLFYFFKRYGAFFL